MKRRTLKHAWGMRPPFFRARTSLLADEKHKPLQKFWSGLLVSGLRGDEFLCSLVGNTQKSTYIA